MKYPVKPMKMPSDLKGVKNGRVPAKLLVKVNSGRLHHQAAKAFHCMVIAAKKDGISLGTVGHYRTFEGQEKLFLDRYQTTPTGRVPKVTRQYQGKTWYLKKGKSPSASPGTSNHGWGLAVDIANASGERLKWLLKNAVSFGFSWEVEEGPNAEAWHLRYYMGDSTTLRVKLSLLVHPWPGKI